MNKPFYMTDLGLIPYYLSVEVWQTGSNICVSQTKYAKNLLDRFRMTDCKISSTSMEKGLKLLAKTNSKAVNESVYRELLGSLIYLTATRPDLSFTVSFISRFMAVPKVKHWTAAKRVFKYVKGTLDFGILYSRNKDPRLCGYTDSNWAGSVDDRKSNSRYVFSLGTGAVTWTSIKQHAVALQYHPYQYNSLHRLY
jgi:hypothetical protein